MYRDSEKISDKWGKRIRWFIIVSIMLHFIFFYSYDVATHFQFFQPDIKKAQQDKQIVFEVIESPEQPDNEDPPDNAKLYSDKNTRAKNPKITDKPSDEPFSAGDESHPVMPSEPTQRNKSPAPVKNEKRTAEDAQSPTEAKDEIRYSPSSQPFSRDALLGRPSNRKKTPPKPDYDSREFSADELGGFAFNTYNWNFAPYLLYLKKRISEHIFPPPAFTRMGIIDGRSIIRFIIARDGKLKGVKVLNYEGHSSLMETSVNAVNGSAPFKPLPGDFPEEVLEVTGNFTYRIYR